MTPTIPKGWAQATEPNEACVEPAAPAMVPGMMIVCGDTYLPLRGLAFGRHGTKEGKLWVGADGFCANAADVWTDDRTPEQFAAAYAAAWEFTERSRAEIQMEVVRQAEPVVTVAFDAEQIAQGLASLAPQPAEPERRPASEKPGNTVDVTVLTPHGESQGWYDATHDEWNIYDSDDNSQVIDPADVRGWKRMQRAKVEGGRVVGVAR